MSEYLQKHPDGYGKSQFYYHRSQNLVAQKDASSVLTNLRKPGEALMIDFAGDKLSYTDIETSEHIAPEDSVVILQTDNDFGALPPTKTASYNVLVEKRAEKEGYKRPEEGEM